MARFDDSLLNVFLFHFFLDHSTARYCTVRLGYILMQCNQGGFNLLLLLSRQTFRKGQSTIILNPPFLSAFSFFVTYFRLVFMFFCGIFSCWWCCCSLPSQIHSARLSVRLDTMLRLFFLIQPCSRFRMRVRCAYALLLW